MESSGIALGLVIVCPQREPAVAPAVTAAVAVAKADDTVAVTVAEEILITVATTMAVLIAATVHHMDTADQPALFPLVVPCDPTCG